MLGIYVGSLDDMTDTERLNLVEYYQWSVKFINNGCHIVLHRASTYAFAKTFRDTIDIAMQKQRYWSLGK